MDNQTVREFCNSLKLYDTSVSAKQAEEYMDSVLNKLSPDELSKFVEAAQKIATINEADNKVKKSLKEIFAEVFPSISFYPALGIWGLIDKMIQNGDITSLDTADRSKLAVYAAIFFGMVGGKIAYNRIKEKANEIKSVDAQISETLRLAGVQLDEEIYNPGKDEIDDGQDLDDEKISQSVREIVQDEHIPLSAAMKKYSEITNISLDIIQNALENSGNAEVEDWELHYGDDQSEFKIFRDKKTGKGESFPLHESEEKHTVRDGVQAIASEKGLSNHDAMKQYAEENGMDFGDVYDMYVYGDDNMSLEDAKKALKRTEEEFEREQYADDFLYSNGGWNRYENEIRYLKRLIKRLEEKRSVNESYESKNNSSLEQAIKYVNDGMKAKYGREYPNEEDEDDYRSELCDAASKKFNVPCDEIIDKFASDYVDTMPYVIKDENDEYSEIPDEIHQMTSSIYD